MDCDSCARSSEVADRGSFSAAAEALGVSQPAVSQQIRALEREIGEPLLDRGGRGARLTERGVMVHRYAQRMLALSDEFQRELADGRRRADRVAGGRLQHRTRRARAAAAAGRLPRGASEGRRCRCGSRPPRRSSTACWPASSSWAWSVRAASHRALTYEPFLRDRVVLAVPAGHRFAGRTVELAELVARAADPDAGRRRRPHGDRGGAAPRRRAPPRPERGDGAGPAGVGQGGRRGRASGSASCRSWPSSGSCERGTLATADVAGIDPVRDFCHRAAGHPAAGAGWPTVPGLEPGLAGAQVLSVSRGGPSPGRTARRCHVPVRPRREVRARRRWPGADPLRGSTTPAVAGSRSIVSVPRTRGRARARAPAWARLAHLSIPPA